jgi:hypothetical protein
MGAAGLRREIKIAAAARAHFAGEEPDKRQPRPLAKPKWTKELFFRVFKSGIECINTRQRHGIPRDGDYAEPTERSTRLNQAALGSWLLALSS